MIRYFVFLSILCLSCSVSTETIPVGETPTQVFPVVNTSIQAVLERIKNNESGFTRFSTEENELWLEGYVTSNDEGGNFFKEIFLQDAAENPSAAIRLAVDLSSNYTKYPKGSKVFVKLNGLGAGKENGMPSLGEFQGNSIGSLSQFLIDEHLQKTTISSIITAKKLNLLKIDPSLLGQFVRVENSQFSSAEAGKTFSSETFDEFNGNRRLIVCSDFSSIWVSSSSFADFKSVVIPSQNGFIEGILTRDFFDEKYILKINSPHDILMKENRCSAFFEESFEESSLGRFEKTGWTNYSEKGIKLWEVFEDKNSLGKSIRINSFRTEEEETISWLITPELNTSSLVNPYFAFRSSTEFPDDSKLEFFISFNWNGEPSSVASATWLITNAKVVQSADDSTQWIESGEVDLSSYRTPFYFGFRYMGSNKGTANGTFELDDLRVVERGD